MSLPYDVGFYINPQRAVAPADAAAGSRNGVDIARGDAHSAVIHAHAGAVTGSPTATSVVYKIQTAPDDGAGAPGTYADMTDRDGNVLQTTAITAANGQAKLNVELSMADQWVRLVETVSFTAGTTPSVLTGASLILNTMTPPA